MQEPENQETYAIVGELVLLASGLDDCVNRVLITVLKLGDADLLLPVVATLDPARKVEILKARAKLIKANDWRNAIGRFLEKVETVNRNRNIACHTAPINEAGKWTLRPIAAAKFLSRLDLDAKTLAHFSIADLKNAIAVGEAALGEGVNLIENFKRLDAEFERRRSKSGDKPTS